jgi:hypothetical protein
MQKSIKYVLSFFKRDWELRDYPVVVRESDAPNGMFNDDRFRPIRWTVRIPDWVRMFGGGDTLEEAWADLERKFAEYKSEGNDLPRPGTKVPIQFAPRVEVVKHDRTAAEFFARIMNMDYSQVLITDQSSLWHFPFEPQDLVEKIRGVYGIEVSEEEDGNLVELFERIEASRGVAEAV